MSKVYLWIGGIFAPVGLLFVSFAAAFLVSDREFVSSAVAGTGTVIAVSGGRAPGGGYARGPIVEFYSEDGVRHQFSSNTSSNPPSFRRGETVKVLYDPVEPSRAVIDTFLHRYLMPAIFGGIGSVLAAVGIGMLLAYWRRKKVISNLLVAGVPIKARFTHCFLDTSTKINGRSPYKVLAQGTNPFTGQLESYESEAIWLDLTAELSGSDVPVLINPNKPRQHFVDLREWVGPDMRA
ncbi:DUF3592 domain-containing protein [Parerythrobacter jejuensis]|uniref:DUF3592 domain-containing protein n=1 Tax=Parerythrobacter jejuensis TaxID=795812 RepID=A0A845AXJ3_9SPHN|nr:DUF3592 domain-containing protein [Parerythrobacter jejuensis]MXP30721.1 DUF3592 domain-containing protein [Parerythrobacter jejuensis]MXP33481.1 DUF3592 domain-containing protein [Parerythrobacter jejuensis]